MITLKRLDFTGTVNAMICITSRHAITADGATQQALDEIVQALHNIDAICARRPTLATILNAPIPPVPPRHPQDDDDLDDVDDLDDLDDTDDADDDLDNDDTDANTQSTADLHPGLVKVLRYIRTNPGCTITDINDATGYSKSTISVYIPELCNAGHNIVRILGKGRTAHYKLEETAQ